MRTGEGCCPNHGDNSHTGLLVRQGLCCGTSILPSASLQLTYSFLKPFSVPLICPAILWPKHWLVLKCCQSLVVKGALQIMKWYKVRPNPEDRTSPNSVTILAGMKVFRRDTSNHWNNRPHEIGISLDILYWEKEKTRKEEKLVSQKETTRYWQLAGPPWGIHSSPDNRPHLAHNCLAQPALYT